MFFKRSHFVYSRRQRNGIFFLLLIIVFSRLYGVYTFYSKDDLVIPISDSLKDSIYRNNLDSIRVSLELKKKLSDSIFPFNPNYISEYKAYRLGFSTKDLNMILAFRDSGNFLRDAEELGALLGYNESRLDSLKPYFRFPIFENYTKVIKKNSVKELCKVIDINEATIFDLTLIDGIGPFKAGRIIAYRDLVGAVVSMEQLEDIEVLDSLNLINVKQCFKVFDSIQAPGWNLNTDSFSSLMKHPYLNYRQVKGIVEYRKDFGGFNTVEDLLKIEYFSSSEIERIALYLCSL
ncbi:MAG: ComEA family DNA-binding protein [Flavobacteriaceae bacterium]